jgi:DNA polymerase-3 subunit epsilon
MGQKRVGAAEAADDLKHGTAIAGRDVRRVILSLETTGLEPDDRITEIGCVELIGRQITDHPFHAYLNPERLVGSSECIHGLSDEFLADKLKFAEVAVDFMDFIRGAELVIHDAEFDVTYLNYELALLKLPPLETVVAGIVDTLKMARAIRPGLKNNINALCADYQLDIPRRQYHGALLDAHMLSEIYLAMTHSGRREILAGTDDVIARHIKVGNHDFRHGIVGRKLTTAPEGFNAKLLIMELIGQIESNLKGARVAPSLGLKLGKSLENWREESPAESLENLNKKRKPERELEHRLAIKAGKNDGQWTWWNQMPVASGLVGYRADRTRAIDLACKRRDDPTHYRLIELKVSRDAGGPLFALMEIVRYGLIYFVLRKNQKANWLADLSFDAEIFDASQVDLCVLAPGDYYHGYELGWLEKKLNDALDVICFEDKFGKKLKMSLTSYWPTKLPEWPEVFPDDEILMSCLTEWEKAYQKGGQATGS